MNDRVAASPHQFILKTGQKWRRRRGQEEERGGGIDESNYQNQITEESL